VLSWVLSAAWVRYALVQEQPVFEPLITFLGGAAALIGSFFVSNKPIKILEISEEEKLARDRRNHSAMLKLVNEIWIEGVLKKSLYNAVLIELGLKERKDAVDMPDKPWSMILQTGGQPNRVLPPGTRIADVFDDAGQALLILGEPGSGKTTTLLELARETIGRAEKDQNQPMPVVFNLSSWIKPAQPLSDWLIDELNTKYNIPKKIANQWVENDQLLLLLDGLDEVAAERRDACVKAINEFRREHLVPITICSRTAEYEALTTSLKVNSSVCIQPLSEQQISDYFNKCGAELTTVRKMLQDDEPLRELSRSPLMLNIMTIAYKGASEEELEKLDTIEARRKHLFNKYIDVMFNRVARTKNELYPRDKTIRWLSWLAEKMTWQAQSVFLIERMQPIWLQTRYQKRKYTISITLIWGLIVWLISGLLVGLIAGLIYGWIGKLLFGLLIGLLTGLIVGLLFGLFEGRKKTIETVESLKWSWKEAKIGLIKGLLIGLLAGLIFGLLAGLIFGLFVGLFVGLLGGLIIGPIELMILSGLSYAEVKERTIPNQGIRQSIKSAAIVLLAIIIGVTLIAGPVAVLVVVFGPNVGLDAEFVKVVVVLIFAVGPILGCCLLADYGGISVIQHFVLRFILYRNGYLPWNIVRFLDYAAERIFLQKVGGGYKFIHRLIQEHFASLR
jgi:hypothetical protein